MNALTNILNNRYFYLSVTLIPILMGIVGFVFLLQSPYTGLNFESKNGKWYISSVDNNSPAAAVPGLLGTEVVSVGAIQVNKDTFVKEFEYIESRDEVLGYMSEHRYFQGYIKTGTPVSITTIDHGKENIISVIPSAAPVWVMLQRQWITILVGMVFLSLGLLMIFKKPDYIPSRLFFASACWVTISIINTGIAYSSDIAIDTDFFIFLYFSTNVASIFATVSIAHFLLVFPRDILGISHSPWAVYALYILAAIVFLLHSLRIYFIVFPIFVLLLLAIGVILFIPIYFRSDPIEKIQMKWIYIGLSLVVVSILSLYTLPVIFIGEGLISYLYIYLIYLFVPVSITFSIMRYRLMEIDTLFDNTLIYSVTIGLLTIMDIVIIYILTSSETTLVALPDPLPTIIAVWVIIFAYLPVRNFVQKHIKRLLKREVYNINQVSIELSKELLSVQSIKEAFQKANALVSGALHPKGCDAFLCNERENFCVFQGVEGSLSFIDDDTTKGIQHPLALYQITDNLPKDYSGGIYVPIIGSNEGRLGYFTLQEKHSGRMYDKDDIKLLDLVSNQLAIVVEALLAKQANEREREKLSEEIHDNLGNIFATAIVLNKNDTLTPVLMEGLTVSRELIWGLTIDESALEDFIYHIRDKFNVLKGNLNIRISSELDDPNILLSPIIKMHLLRILQESVTNTIKHAHATEITIRFDEKGKHLTIEITDNGIGFDTSILYDGHGLNNLPRRAKELNATLSIVSEIGKGTATKIEMELD